MDAPTPIYGIVLQMTVRNLLEGLQEPQIGDKIRQTFGTIFENRPSFSIQSQGGSVKFCQAV